MKKIEIFCDKCHKKIDPVSSFEGFDILNYRKITWDNEDFDFCPDCYEKVKAYLKGLKHG